MRAKSHQFKNGVVNFAVDQNKIRPDMAITAITAIIQRPDQRMIDGIRGQSLVLCQKNKDSLQECVKFPAVYP